MKYTLQSPVSQSTSLVHAPPIEFAALAGGAIAANTSTVATIAAPLPTMVGMRGVRVKWKSAAEAALGTRFFSCELS